MRVHCFRTFDELTPHADDWDRLAGEVPFRTWAWMSCWWRHYGHRPDDRGRLQLFVLGVFDDAGRLAGLAPWCLNRTASGGRTLRWLGSGEVCCDYLSILCQPGMTSGVTAALADYLTGYAPGPGRGGPQWDVFDLSGIEAKEPAVLMLAESFADRGCPVHFRRGADCWRLNLPGSWEQYLAMLSKSHRKQVRRLQRKKLDAGRAVLHTVQCADDLPQAADILVRLHQRRRHALGQRGCFSSPRFAAFHREVMPLLLANGQLQLHWLELDGRPIAAEYHFAAGRVVYAYQAGIEPEALEHEPGRLIMVATVRRAIEQGAQAIDFLRGDEPYKAHFRAKPQPCLALRMVPNHAAAKLRHRLWLAANKLKTWVRPQATISIP